MKAFPSELVNPLLSIINQTIMQYEILVKMSEEEILSLLSQTQEFIKQKVKQEKVADILQDMRVRELITGTKVTFQTILDDANKIKAWLEKDDVPEPSVN